MRTYEGTYHLVRDFFESKDYIFLDATSIIFGDVVSKIPLVKDGINYPIGHKFEKAILDVFLGQLTFFFKDIPYVRKENEIQVKLKFCVKE
jgi:hypothetical protein